MQNSITTPTNDAPVSILPNKNGQKYILLAVAIISVLVVVITVFVIILWSSNKRQINNKLSDNANLIMDGSGKEKDPETETQELATGTPEVSTTPVAKVTQTSTPKASGAPIPTLKPTLKLTPVITNSPKPTQTSAPTSDREIIKLTDTYEPNAPLTISFQKESGFIVNKSNITNGTPSFIVSSGTTSVTVMYDAGPLPLMPIAPVTYSNVRTAATKIVCPLSTAAPFNYSCLVDIYALTVPGRTGTYYTDQVSNTSCLSPYSDSTIAAPCGTEFPKLGSASTTIMVKCEGTNTAFCDKVIKTLAFGN